MTDGPIGSSCLTTPTAASSLERRACTGTRSVLEARRFDSGAESTPTVSRRFIRTDRLVIDIPWTSVSRVPDVGARLTGRDGTSLATLPVVSTDAQRARIVLPLVNLAPGTYVVRVDATAGDDRATQQVAFTVSQ